jgi:hypothetical protein
LTNKRNENRKENLSSIKLQNILENKGSSKQEKIQNFMNLFENYKLETIANSIKNSSFYELLAKNCLKNTFVEVTGKIITGDMIV